MTEESKGMTIVRVSEKASASARRDSSAALQIVRVTHADPVRLELVEGKYFQADRSPQLKQAVELALQAVERRDSYVELPRGIDPREVKHILAREHPQLFMVSNTYEYIFTDRISRLFFFYLYSAEEARRLRQLINEEVSRIVRGARRRKGAVERLRYVYDWFCGNLTYHRAENHPPEDYTAVGVFVRRTAVCAGFARAFQMVCRRLGIDSAYICGKLEADDEIGHAWNLVWLDGDIYHIDATAGVTFFEATGRLAYPCFLNTAEEMLRARLIETPFPRRDNPGGTYLASIGCRFENAGELDRILLGFAGGAQRLLCIQAGEAYADERRMMEEIRGAMRRTGCAGMMMYHYSNGVCMILKEKSKRTSMELRVIKLTVL